MWALAMDQRGIADGFGQPFWIRKRFSLRWGIGARRLSYAFIIAFQLQPATTPILERFTDGFLTTNTMSRSLAKSTITKVFILFYGIG
jgi:hypothetical protein